MESGTMKAMIVEKHMTKNGIHCSSKEDTKRQRTPRQQTYNLSWKNIQQYNYRLRHCIVLSSLSMYLSLYFPEKAHGELKVWQELLQANQKASKGAMEARKWRYTAQHEMARLAS